MKPVTTGVAFLSMGLLVAGCGGSGADGVDAAAHDDAAVHDGAPPSDSSAAEPESIVGGLQVRDHGSVPIWVWGFNERPAPGALFGVVGEGFWEPSIVEGECVYLTAIDPGFCDPACGYDSYCDREGECQLWPARVDAGTLHLLGLAEDATITANENHYYSVVEDLPDVMFTGGETATLNAEGGQIPAFSLSTVAPEPFVDEIDCDLTLAPTEDLTITWTPGTGSSRVRWEMITMMHAGNGPMVLCETDDTGSLVVPAQMIAAFLEDRTQWPTYQLSRYTRATAPLGDDLHVGLEALSTEYCFILP